MLKTKMVRIYFWMLQANCDNSREELISKPLIPNRLFEDLQSDI